MSRYTPLARLTLGEKTSLQHLRAVLPCEVRVISRTHPLSGRLVAARSFKRLNGVLLLVIELPDGSPGTIPADATDLLGAVADRGPAVVHTLNQLVASASWLWREQALEPLVIIDPGLSVRLA